MTRQLIAGGAVERGYVGITIGTLLETIREALGLDAGLEGALVIAVNPDGPADRAGLEAGDIVVSADGEPIADNNELTRLVAGVGVGETVTLDVLRGGHSVSVSIRAAARPSAEELASFNVARQDLPEFPAAGTVPGEQAVAGLVLAPINARVRGLYGLEDHISGVVITDIRAHSPWSSPQRLRPGDVITRADTVAVSDPDDLESVIARLRAEGRTSLLLFINRAGQVDLRIVEIENIPVADAGEDK